MCLGLSPVISCFTALSQDDRLHQLLMLAPLPRRHSLVRIKSLTAAANNTHGVLPSPRPLSCLKQEGRETLQATTRPMIDMFLNDYPFFRNGSPSGVDDGTVDSLCRPTIALYPTVWPQFALQALTGVGWVEPPVWRKGGCRRWRWVPSVVWWW